MARIFEPTEDQLKDWQEWLLSRPQRVRAVAEKFEPWNLYRLKDTGQRVIVYSFQESDDSITLTVIVSGEYNAVMFEGRVFGINPEDLEICDLPDPSEELGSVLTPEEADENIDAIRVIARPDLWEMNEDGKAVRRSK